MDGVYLAFFKRGGRSPSQKISIVQTSVSSGRSIPSNVRDDWDRKCYKSAP